MFCSARCRDALGWSPSRKICGECGDAFYPEHRRQSHSQRFCSARCKEHFHDRARTARRRAARQPRTCEHCGKSFPPIDRFDGGKRYCSITCRRQAQVLRDRARRDQPIPIPAHVFIHEYAYAGDK